MEDGTALRSVVGDHGSARALLDGEVQVPGLTLEFLKIRPMIGAYRRMIRELEFDVCEMAPTTYVIAREAGIPITALPVFLMRRFHHSDIACRAGSGIEQPRDLQGREVGLRAYSVTTGVWVRGFLGEQYDVDLDAITWVVDDDEHVETLALPGNVRRLPAGESVADLFAAGGLDAALGGNAGTGRSGSPTGRWVERAAPSLTYPLIGDPQRATVEWYRATGVYPLHSLVCIRDSVLNRHPWVAEALFAGFQASKQQFLRELAKPMTDVTDETPSEEVSRYRELITIVGDDPLPYGIDANVATLEALVRFSFDQGLITRAADPAALFV